MSDIKNTASQPSDSKVVPIHERLSGNGHLPSLVLRVSDKARQTLLPMLRAVFDRADDSLFELADKAGSNSEQNLYFEAMREIRVRRRGMEQAFINGLQQNFQALVSGVRRDGTVNVLSSDELSLVQNEDLEEMVAADAMVNKVSENSANAIESLRLRLEQIVGNKVARQHHPLAPRSICDAFMSATSEMPVDIKAKLVFYKLFDKLVMSELGAVYRTLNQVLIDQGILPDLVIGPNKAKKTPKAAKPEPKTSSNSQTVSNEASGAESGVVLGQLQSLLQQRQGDSQAQGNVLPREQLLRNISQLQNSTFEANSVAYSTTSEEGQEGELIPLDVGALLRAQGMNLAKVDDDVINLVSMLFGFILGDQNLAGPIKALLARLQLPLVRLALMDKTFFDKDGHPARRLLNEMANMALGWQQGDDLLEDRLYRKVESVVDEISHSEEDNVEFYGDQLSELLSFSQKEQRRVQIMERRLLDAERGKAQSQEARNVVNLELEALVLDHTLPEAGEKLLREAWGNVMYLIYLREGPESEGWGKSLETARDLVVSLTPPESREERQKLIKLIPGLLKQLRIGLEEVSFNPFDMRDLFDQLEKLHLANIRVPFAQPSGQEQTKEPVIKEPTSESVVASNPQSSIPQENTSESVSGDVEAEKPAVVAESSKQVAAEKVVQESPNNSTQRESEDTPENTSESTKVASAAIEINTSNAQETTKTGSDDAEYRRLASQLTVGTWLEMEDAGGNPVRCRLAAYIKPTQKYIFVNRSGVKVAETSLGELAEALSEGSMSVMDDSQLFDRALESVIGDLRQQRGI